MDASDVTENFYERLLTKLGELAMLTVRPSIPSQTLQNALVLEVGTSLREPRAVLYIPHYWAVYVHDGRGPVRPTEKTWLVWFKNPQDDPRTGGGSAYPVRASEARRLTPAEWAHGLEENRRRKNAGQEPYMIVTKHAGPVTNGASFEFFEKGLENFAAEAAPIVHAEMDRYVRDMLRQIGFIGRKTDTSIRALEL